MSQQNISSDIEQDRARATADARAELLRQAEEQGVRPINFDELLGDPEAGDPEKEDVDDFLALRREWRETERAHSSPCGASGARQSAHIFLVRAEVEAQLSE